MRLPRRPGSAREAAAPDEPGTGPAPAPGPWLPALLTTVGLALGPAVAIGLARFAYSLLLPAMRSSLHWSFAQAGAMSTASALGYLLGAVVAGPLVIRAGSRRPYLAGLGLTALALLASAGSSGFILLLALRVVAGVTGAVVFITGAGLVAHLVAGLARGRAAALLGIYFSGAGLGIVISALVVPPLVFGAAASWRWGWIALGCASLAALGGATPAALRAREPTVGRGQGLFGWPVRRMAPAMAGYSLFGAGYIAYVTFIVAFLKAQGFSASTVGVFWAVLGAASVAAPFAWGPVLGRLRAGRGPAAVLVVVTVGAMLPLELAGTAGDFASAVLFGGAFLIVVTAVVNLARLALPAAQISPAIAVLTVAFGIGQCVGPILAGFLSDGPGGVRTGLELSVVLLAAATLAAFMQQTPRRRARPGTPCPPPPSRGSSHIPPAGTLDRLAGCCHVLHTTRRRSRGHGSCRAITPERAGP